MDHRKQFSLLVVRGDGVRVLRFNFPRRRPVVALVVLAVVASVFGALVGDWWQVRHRMRDSASLLAQLDEQSAVIDSFNRRVAELRKEVASWHDMHARIREPFGPERALKSAQVGIGGRPSPPDRPGGSGAPLDELELLTETVAEAGQNLRALDGMIARARKAIVSLPSRWPVRGAVNSEFGNRQGPWTRTSEFHGGMDIAAERGTVVRAPAAGSVAVAGPYSEYGIAVILEHGNDIKSIYGHLSKVMVRPGQRVERGTELAFTGNTGRSSGPHLHYEILVKGHAVNPRTYLWD